jgi:hypothetical protein
LHAGEGDEALPLGLQGPALPKEGGRKSTSADAAGNGAAQVEAELRDLLVAELADELFDEALGDMLPELGRGGAAGPSLGRGLPPRRGVFSIEAAFAARAALPDVVDVDDLVDDESEDEDIY